MSLHYFEEKASFYQNVFLSFYRNIVYKNIVCDVGHKMTLTFIDINITLSDIVKIDSINWSFCLRHVHCM